MKIVLIGIQGSGKSTQGNLLSKQLKIPYLSTGHIFRKIATEKNILGRYVKNIMSAGLLISDGKTLEIVEEYLNRPEYRKGYILDGFPRTLKQAKSFKNGIDKVICIDLPDKEALWRVAKYRNNDEETRDDDTIIALKKRLDIFHKTTTSVIEYYKKKGLLTVVDGSGTITEVNEQILKGLGKQIIKKKLKDWERKNRIIIAIVGLQGAGKTEATKYFKNIQIPVISFGKIINDHLNKHNLVHTTQNHKEVRMAFRKKYGMEALAVLNKDKINEAFKKNSIIVIDGLRSYQEYQYLSNQFSNVDLVVIAIWAPYSKRMKRIKSRAKRKILTGRQRDYDEVIEANMGATIALADYFIINESSFEEFYHKLENVYRELYYS